MLTATNKARLAVAAGDGGGGGGSLVMTPAALRVLRLSRLELIEEIRRELDEPTRR